MSKFLQNIKINIRSILAVLSTIGIFGLLFMFCYKEIPQANKEIVQRAVDQILIVGIALVFAFYFGSSKNETDQKKHEQKMKEQE